MEHVPAQNRCGLIARRLRFGQPIQCDRQFAHANTTRMPDLIGDRTRDAGPSARVLDRIGDKWSVMVVAVVGDGPKRFNELRRAIANISQRMLTLTLATRHASDVSYHSASSGLRVDQTRLFSA